MHEAVFPEVVWNTESPGVLQVGAAAVSISPSFQVFLAGGAPYRLAQSYHDEIWARAIVLDDGSYRIALIAVDLIGVQYDDVVRIRERVAASEDVDYLLVAATHTHSAPDTMGVWSPDFVCGEDLYMPFLREWIAQAVSDAVARLTPARLRIAQGDSGEPRLSRDTRAPDAVDDTLTVWQAVSVVSEETIATCVHYAAHPVLISSIDTGISSDFPNWLRSAVESGVSGEIAVSGQGGVCLFFNGALGGRIVPAHTEPMTLTTIVNPFHARAEAYGYRLARRAIDLLDAAADEYEIDNGISVATKHLRIPMENPLLGAALSLCLIDRSHVDGEVNTEVGVVRVGPLEFFAVPGMVFPEWLDGTTRPLNGVDNPDAGLEAPSIADLSTREYPVVVGPANDMLGYIIPATLWDAEPPYCTADGLPPYGEIISPGPSCSPRVTAALAEAAAALP